MLPKPVKAMGEVKILHFGLSEMLFEIFIDNADLSIELSKGDMDMPTQKPPKTSAEKTKKKKRKQPMS